MRRNSNRYVMAPHGRSVMARSLHCLSFRHALNFVYRCGSVKGVAGPPNSGCRPTLLLRPRCQRPRHSRAAEQSDELAPLQLMELHSVLPRACLIWGIPV